MRISSVRNERGIALVAAIVALVVIGAIVAGTFFISTLEQKTAENSVDASQAYQAAESGIVANTAGWDTGNNSMATDASVSLGTTSLGGGSSYTVTLSRLTSSLFLLKSAGTKGTATQTLASVLRLAVVNPSVGAAVTAKGSVNVGGNATIDGHNTNPPGWSGCGTGSDKGGIRTNSTVSTNGNPTISGSPATIQNDAAVNDALFQGPFNQLKAMANMTLAGASGANNYITYNGMTPSTTGSPARCDRTDVNNWGEPLRSGGGYVSQCTGYAPIIYFSGNAKVTNGRGQGILLIDGDFSIAGNFSFTGLVIAMGQVKTGNGTSNVNGAIMANNADIGDQTNFSGTPVVSYSKCAIDYVLNAGAVARPIALRAWSQVY
ncbi:MAG TPA: pilus assembly PilX N-terminal domain-containing protein [Gemmatimonadales bacterium]|nr:pilus assembly PilX N-terminal domain-containing protein [Gemmatimonadales bacterium]